MQRQMEQIQQRLQALHRVISRHLQALGQDVTQLPQHTQQARQDLHHG